MAAIGTYTVLTMQGAVIPGGERLEEITRPGVDGVAFRRIGKKGAAFKLKTTVDVASATDAKTLLENYKALQGYIVRVVDTAGRTWDNLIVLQVRTGAPQRILSGSGGLTGSPNFLLTADWTLQAAI